MRALKHTLLALLISIFASPSMADADHPAIPAPEHGPLGVMQDHMHDKGEWMLSYRYMRMDMGGTKVGSNSISTAETHQQFMVSPTNMEMDMHMLGAMYGVSSKVTVMAMVPYLNKSMDHVTRMGGRFNTSTNGVGDIKLAAMVSLLKEAGQSAHLNLGISLPTGSIGERAAIPINPDAQLPYPMQIGSGTWDLMPGITFTGTSNRLYWGAQAMATIRTGTNSRDYRLGNKFQLTAWNMFRLTPAFDAGMRVSYNRWGNVHGVDAELIPMLVQTANADLQGGDRVDISFALNYQVQGGTLQGHRLAAEFTLPVYQKLDGPQMEHNWSLMIGWQKAF
jgi:hypothetical protein